MLVDLDMQDFKRLLELAREGFSQGWDGLDSQERLDEIKRLEDNVVSAVCDYCINPATRSLCGKCAHRYGAR